MAMANSCIHYDRRRFVSFGTPVDGMCVCKYMARYISPKEIHPSNTPKLLAIPTPVLLYVLRSVCGGKAPAHPQWYRLKIKTLALHGGSTVISPMCYATGCSKAPSRSRNSGSSRAHNLEIERQNLDPCT